jgi:ABC-type transport system involved in cytochrome c biogenesis permease component
MIFLPIADRELRVASRRRATYWMRFFLAFGVFVIWFLLVLMAPAATPISKGKLLFGALSILMLVFCLLAGVFLTADSISEEKREGTLGLLFLTDLKGYDIAFGKLLATSVHAFYGLLAVLPLLAYSMLIGGVTPGEFWRMTIALTATLVLSLSAGLVISVHNRETRLAMGSCGLALAVLCGLFPILSWLAGLILRTRWPQVLLGWPSPVCAFWYAFDAPFHSKSGVWRFWGSLVVVLSMGAAALAAAGFSVAGAWRDKPAQPEAAGKGAAWLARLRIVDKASGPRRRLLDEDSFCWLVTRDRLPVLLATGVLVVGVPVWLAFVAFALIHKPSPFGLGVALVICYLVHHALKWLVAIEASRRLSDDRQNGALELLLVTPLSVETLLNGQIRALRRMFRIPFLIAGSMNAVLFLVACLGKLPLGTEGTVVLCELLIGGSVMLFVDFSVLGWVGMWMAMINKRHHRAVMSTLARVILAPWAANFFLVLLTIGGAGLTFATSLALSPLWFGLAIVLEEAFRARAKVGLLAALRQITADSSLNVHSPTFLDEAVRLNPAPGPAN